MATIIDTYHVPVLLEESVGGLDIKHDGTYVDVTFGGGGHSRRILQELDGGGHLYSFDQDADAEKNVSPQDNFTFVRSNFRYLKNWMRYYGVEGLDGLLADLGVSSHHFDDETRGFSFRFDAPLDMRMNKRGGENAADLVNERSEEELADMFYLYGELKNSRRIAKAIAKEGAETDTDDTGPDGCHTAAVSKGKGKEGHGEDVPSAAHRGEPRDDGTEGDARLCHGTAETGRQTVGDNIPQSGGQDSKELHEDGKCRRQDDTGLLRKGGDTVQTCQQQSDSAIRRRTAGQPAKQKRKTENCREKRTGRQIVETNKRNERRLY